jgi:hypothetical protein
MPTHRGRYVAPSSFAEVAMPTIRTVFFDEAPSSVFREAEARRAEAPPVTTTPSGVRAKFSIPLDDARWVGVDFSAFDPTKAFGAEGAFVLRMPDGRYLRDSPQALEALPVCALETTEDPQKAYRCARREDLLRAQKEISGGQIRWLDYASGEVGPCPRGGI